MVSKKKTGLGRGLEALFGEDSVSDNETVVEIELSKIVPNPFQPRKTFSDSALSELATSIKQNGVLQPVTLRKKGAKYQLITGERRFRACGLNKMKTIPAIVRELTDDQMMEVAVLENLQREDLTPLEEAEAYYTLMERLNLTQVEVSTRLGKSRPYIANYIRLRGLPDEVKALLQENKLSAGQARTLLALKKPAHQVQLAEKTVREGLTVRQLEQEVAKLNGGQKKKPAKAKDKNAPYFDRCADLMADKFATKIAIKTGGKKGNGKIEINYANTDDFNRILDLLGISLD